MLPLTAGEDRLPALEVAVKLADKTLVITGGGGGIGRQLVLQALERGARVAAVDLRMAAMEETAVLAKAGDRLSLHECNITDREAVHALPAAVIAAHGAVDGVVNNAGIIQPFTNVVALDYATIERVIDVNLWGTIHMVKAFLPELMNRPVAHLVNVSSMGGFLPFPGQTVYGASKAAVKLLTEGLYTELLGSQVAVSVVMPGAVATDITGNSGVGGHSPEQAEDSALKPLPAPDAARIIWDGVEADKLHILVGKDAKALNLASRLAPGPAARFITKQMEKMLPKE